jgi:hypothetical protein
MENENIKPSGFGKEDKSDSKTKRSRKKKSDLVMGIPTPPVEEIVEEKVEPVYEPPAPAAPTPPAPVVATGRTKPHRIFPSRYRP